MTSEDITLLKQRIHSRGQRVQPTEAKQELAVDPGQTGRAATIHESRPHSVPHRPAPRVSMMYKVNKRLMDVIIASTLLFLLSPLFLMIALFIKLNDRGPVFFVQKRVGRKGKQFSFFKFRTMVPNAERLKDQLEAQNRFQNDVTFKIQADPRVTPVGRLLRKTSLDELPQLWNVVRGEMSLVGPRPPLPREVFRYSPVERKRLDVTPGLTCLWQVSGRSDLPFEKQVELDLHYIQHQSLWMDILLILKTIPAICFMRGAY